MLYSIIVINWLSVIFNSFWIVGTAILVSSFSYHYYLAHLNEQSLNEQFNQPIFQKTFWFGISLISVGLAGTSQKSWEIIIWIIFMLLSIVNMVKA